MSTVSTRSLVYHKKCCIRWPVAANDGNPSVPTSNSGGDDSELDIMGSAVVSSGTVTPGMDEFDINTRDRLAATWIEMGDLEEGRLWLPRPHSNSSLIIVQDARELHLA